MSKLSLLIAIALATPALAQESLPDAPVRYRDLNLTSPDGVRTLDRRIAAAIKRACPYPIHADLGTAMEVDHCRRDKHAEVMAQRDRVLAAAQSDTRVASVH
jgi:UrcA family protein